MDSGSEKLSISLPASLVAFVEQYRKEHAIASRSKVFERALRVLRERELERAYAEAAVENAEIARDFDTTAGDGLRDEAW